MRVGDRGYRASHGRADRIQFQEVKRAAAERREMEQAGKIGKRGREEERVFLLASPLIALAALQNNTSHTKKTHRAVLKQPVKHGAVRLPDAAHVEPPHLRQELVLVVRRDRLQKLDVVVGVELLDLRLRPRRGPVEHHRLLEVVVGHERVGEADAVGPHGVAPSVVERACDERLRWSWWCFFLF